MTVPSLDEAVSWGLAIGIGLAVAVGSFFAICEFFGVEWDSDRGSHK